mgnify:CR=1 FL=1
MLLLCITMLIFHNRTSAKNPDFCQKSAQNTEIFPQKTFFYIYTILFRFSTTPTAPPPPQVCQSGLTIRGNSKKRTYDGKNVASVAYVVDNSQICIGRYNRTLGTLTSVDAGGSRMWSLLGEDEMERAPSAGLGLADAIWGEQFYDWIEKEF